MVSVSGTGVHSGARCTVTLHAVLGPVRFRRNGTEIPADLQAVVATERSTTLAKGGERVAQVEHLLAALTILGRWHGVLIEASASELPILDGSARVWLQALEQLQAPTQKARKVRPAGRVEVRHGTGWAMAEPGPSALDYTIDFSHPAIGKQHWHGAPSMFASLAAARTFGFASEAASLRARGFALGSSLDNAIVFGEVGPLNALRSADEPVRHKALDALGDLFLLGGPVDGRLRIVRGSHAVHLALVTSLRARSLDQERGDGGP